MADQDPASRTEEPTPKRQEEARTEGQVPHSVEVTSTAVLLGAVLIASQFGPRMLDGLREMMRQNLLDLSAVDLTQGQLIALLRGRFGSAVSAVAPLIFGTALVAFIVSVSQVGLAFRPKRVKPKMSKLSPATGLGRIFSKRGVVLLAKSIIKIALVGFITWLLMRASQDQVIALVATSPREILGVAGEQVFAVVIWAAGALSVLAGFDYAWERFEHHQGLRMTRSEVKDERRQAEGDPQIRGRVKRAYQELTTRSLADVPTANVVVTNPTHVAVALRYASGETGAPIVVAKGAEEVAARIKEIARKHGIPILERRALARSLFKSVRVGGEIPSSLYRAVAEILAYIYALQSRRVG